MKTSKNRLFIFLSVFLCVFSISHHNVFGSEQFDYAPLFEFFNGIEQKVLDGKENEAIEILNSILSIDSEVFLEQGADPENILFSRMLAYKLRALIRLYYQGFYNEAINDLNKGLTLDGLIEPSSNPLAFMYLYYRSLAYFQAGNFTKAISDITEGIKLFDEYVKLTGAPPADLSSLYQIRGTCYSANRIPEKAKKDLKKSVDLGNFSDSVFMGYAYEFDRSEQFNDAALFYKKISFSEKLFSVDYLDKPIALKTKAFISDRIISASKYIDIPNDVLTNALIYLKAFESGPDQSDKLLTKRTQSLLKTLGYDPGPIDGIAGEKTNTAIRQYQKDFEFPIDGKVTEEIYNRLKITLTVSDKKSPPLSNIDVTVPQLIKRVMPSTVLISTFNKKNKPIGLGSGFFVKNSKIITNFHVIQGAHSVIIKTHDGDFYQATNIVTDKGNDLAMLSLDKPLEISPLNISKKLPDVGQSIIVIGNPLGAEQTVSDGIVSAIRHFKNDGTMIQISAPISGGSSGGPVINLKGEVIGVSTLMIKEGQNINFAVSAQHINVLLSENN